MKIISILILAATLYGCTNHFSKDVMIDNLYCKYKNQVCVCGYRMYQVAALAIDPSGKLCDGEENGAIP